MTQAFGSVRCSRSQEDKSESKSDNAKNTLACIEKDGVIRSAEDVLS